MKQLLLIILLATVVLSAPIYSIESGVPNSWIVVYEKGVSAQQVQTHKQKLSTIDPRSEIKWEYNTVLNGFSGSFNNDAVKYLASQAGVKFIEQNQYAYATCVTQENVPWGLNRISTKGFSRPTGEYTYDLDGSNTNAYILDTGIRKSHVEFWDYDTQETRAVFGFSAINEADGDFNGHGTHVAGTVGGVNVGVAKKVKLIDVKVLSASGSGTWDGVIAGIDWAVQHTKSTGIPSVANMSLGGGRSVAVDSACIEAGNHLVLVVAAGNNNGDAANTSPGNLGNSSMDILSIGSISEAVEGGGPDYRSPFSNYGSSVSLFAPGAAVRSAWYTGDESYNTISGTSMASPHVCGIAAQIAGTFNIPVPDIGRVIKQTILRQASTDTIATLPIGTPNLVAYSGCSISK
eukprot:TRINITY_DN5141_c0_g1_i1.p1 TRINITY_DN5141_c0_g1~~TRINITY_DN5141_c0_g1_i1.p1  ORF type:complete len:404 (+),score=111.15 TRINITY_DN5141_c0_g1_i1:83-1294(+)